MSETSRERKEYVDKKKRSNNDNNVYELSMGYIVDGIARRVTCSAQSAILAIPLAYIVVRGRVSRPFSVEHAVKIGRSPSIGTTDFHRAYTRSRGFLRLGLLPGQTDGNFRSATASCPLPPPAAGHLNY